uniref:Anaphase-promoting complex subunit 10 n=1 Tax=Amblyomma maculatum TaxID=34609 RepID=G3MTI3_AMBMU
MTINAAVPRLEMERGVRDAGAQAVWSLSSCKPGYGINHLLDDCLDNYWQSDGILPHEVNIQFHRKMAIQAVVMYVDYSRDESYTPKRISVRVGSTFHDLQVVDTIVLNEPTGWVRITPRDSAGRPVRAFHVQIAVLENHKNGQDTHIRHMKVFTPLPPLGFSLLPNVTFSSQEGQAYSGIR